MFKKNVSPTTTGAAYLGNVCCLCVKESQCTAVVIPHNGDVPHSLKLLIRTLKLYRQQYRADACGVYPVINVFN